MSYEEVEMGLPPVNEVNSPLFTRQEATQSEPSRNNYEDVETDTPQSSLERKEKVTDKTKNPNERYAVFKVPPPPPPKPKETQKHQKQHAPDPPTQLQPPQRIYSLEETNSDIVEEQDTDDDNDHISRARKYGGFVLILLPAIFGTLSVQFIKYLMIHHQVYVIALCIFQGILWSSAFFVIYTTYWMKRRVIKSISCTISEGWKNMAQLMFLSILGSFAIIFQIVSLHHIDITVSLAISFSPLVFNALIEHISSTRKCTIELIITSLMAYGGLVVLSMAALTTADGRHQKNLLIGVGTAVSSMILTMPSSLLLSKLRSKNVEDSLTATIFAVIGTLISLLLMGAMLTFHSSSSSSSSTPEANPGYIASLIAFMLCGTFFLILDSIYQNKSPTAKVVMRISATRMGIFIFSGIWEILKRGFFPHEFPFPSVFSIFGVILLLISYALTLGFQAWYKQVVLVENKNNDDSSTSKNVRPFEFFPWLFGRSFI